MAEFCVLVTAKAPEPGRVKTRLRPPATLEQAADIAAAALLDTLDTVCALGRGPVVVALSGDHRRAARRDEIDAALRRVTVIGQRGKDFAARLAHAHADAAALCPGLPVLQIGMDTPQITHRLIDSAWAALRRDRDGVLGPATDGGWWLLGLRDPARASALRKVPMSRPDTGQRTLAALAAAGVDVASAAILSDVDTMADAREVAGMVRGSRFARAVAAVHR